MQPTRTTCADNLDQTLENKVCLAVSKVFQVDRDALSPETEFIDLGLDSIRTVDLIAALEKELLIQIGQFDLVGVETVGALVQWVKNKFTGRPAKEMSFGTPLPPRTWKCSCGERAEQGKSCRCGNGPIRTTGKRLP